MLTPQQIRKIENLDDPVIKRRYLKFFQLSTDLQETIFSEKTADKIGEISKKYNLSEEQIWQFSYLIGLTLLGEMFIGDFTKKIQENCGLDELAAKKIVQEIAREIFAPVKESLKKVHGLIPDLESAPSSPSESADLAEKEGKPEIPTTRPTYREPIEELPVQKPIGPEPKPFREIPVPPSNIIDLKNL